MYFLSNIHKRRNRRQFFLLEINPTKIIFFCIIGSIFFFIIAFITVLILSRDLPEPGKIKKSSDYSTIFYDRDGKIIYEMYKDKNRIPVSIEKVPIVLQQATIAIEDANFYSHSGFSIKGILRGLIHTIFKGKKEGGSTLTQQLVKNVLLTREKSISRKIKEFVLAIEIERRYSKKEILEMYLNESPYGGTFWGVQSASQGYFGKDVSELTLIESAFLAGLPQRPSYYSPYINPNKTYIRRTRDVLRRMREEGYITREEEKNASDKLLNLKFRNSGFSMLAPHFIFYVRGLLIEKFGEKVLDSGLSIKTTLSTSIQRIAERIVKEEIEKLKKLNVTNGSMVVLDSKTNEILAMVGSYDFNDPNYGRFNATTALRQPGSALKPITYAVALETGYTAATVLWDVRTEFPVIPGGKPYIPENYDGKYRGPIQVRFALGNSINVPAVKMTAILGVKKILQKAYEMGLETLEPNEKNLSRLGLSITLGGGEVRLLDLTSAFSVFARGGIKISPSCILEVRDNKGRIIYKPEKPTPKRVLSESVAFIISHILSDNNARSAVFGTHSYLNIPNKTVAVKTGTTNDKRDNLAIGFTKSITVGVWVGNNDNSPMDPKIASGVTGASPIWNRMMKELLEIYEDGIIDKPKDVIAVEINSFLGGLPKEGDPRRSEYFISGTEPDSISEYYKKLKISKNTGDLANDLEIKLGQYEEKEFIVVTEEDPISKDGRNRWQEAIDAWIKEQQDERFRPPKKISDANRDEIIVRIKSPLDNQFFLENTISVIGQIISLDPIVSTEILLNGETIKTIDGDKRELSETLGLSNGTYTLQVNSKNTSGKIGSSKVTFSINSKINTSPTFISSPSGIQ